MPTSDLHVLAMPAAVLHETPVEGVALFDALTQFGALLGTQAVMKIAHGIHHAGGMLLHRLDTAGDQGHRRASGRGH